MFEFLAEIYSWATVLFVCNLEKALKSKGIIEHINNTVMSKFNFLNLGL